MNIETINETINSTKTISHEKRIKVVEGDMSVPDIKPDILSLVSVDNEVYITKQQIENNKLNIEGMVDICAIYMSEDETGSLKSLNNVYNFYDTLDIENLNENSIVDLKVFKGSTECKIINGRKLNIKTPVTLDVRVINNYEYSIARDVVDDRNIEIQKNKMNINTLCDCKSQDVELRENVTLNENSEPIGEILKATIKIRNEDFKISYNKILAKADAVVKIIYIADNERQTLETFETTIPVMGFIDYEGINENMGIKLDFNIKSFIIRPIYQDLKSVSFTVESDVCVKASIYKSCEIELISDIYDPDKELKCEYENIEVLQNIVNQTENIEMVQGLMIPELDGIRILNIEATPNIVNKNILDGKLALEGNIEFNILYFNENKKILENKKMELPFQQVVKVATLQSTMNTEVRIDILNIDYRKVNDSQLQIKLDFKYDVSVERVDRISGIKSIEILDIEQIKLPSIIIYYVKPGDTLWNIAKKYRTTVKEIMENNNLTDDKIYPNQQLIIQKRALKVGVELL